LIKNIISKEVAESLTPGRKDFKSEKIMNVLSKLEDTIGKRNYHPPSYCVVEAGKDGHNWHIDTGTNGHMQWCNYGISILLKKSSKGLFKYKEPNKEYTQNEHYLNAIVHSSDQWHMVEESDKGRTVLLMFLQ
jgi:hypothetical protein